MQQRIGEIALLVAEYDEAIEFYVRKLRFTLLEDTLLTPTKRWVRVAPPGIASCSLLLARAVGEEQISRIGNQTGGRVFLFLHTDDFKRDYAHLLSENITIVRGPSDEPYGQVLVFADLYGNLWDLIGPSVPGK